MWQSVFFAEAINITIPNKAHFLQGNPSECIPYICCFYDSRENNDNGVIFERKTSNLIHEPPNYLQSAMLGVKTAVITPVNGLKMANKNGLNCVVLTLLIGAP